MTNTPKPEALKGCPFCGGAARMARAGLDWFVHCEKCFCGTDHMDTPEDARDVWNTREAATTITSLAAERDALRSALQRYGRHDRDCLSRKGAHYGPEHCDCGFGEVRG